MCRNLLGNYSEHPDAQVSHATCQEKSAQQAMTSDNKILIEAASAVSKDPAPTVKTKTSKGHVFEFVQRAGFGQMVKAPDGTHWSWFQGRFENDGKIVNGEIVDSDAAKHCESAGGKLPKKSDFEVLASYFEQDEEGNFTSNGRKDFVSIFPHLQKISSWTSTKAPDDPEDTWIFDGNQDTKYHYAFVFSSWGEIGKWETVVSVPVVCIARESLPKTDTGKK